MERRCLKPKALKVKACPVGSCEQRCSSELGVSFDKRDSFGDHRSVSITGDSKKKRKSVVRRESADTREYERHTDGMDFDMNESMEEVSFESDSAGWYEPNRGAKGNAGRKVSSSMTSLAAVMVEDEGEPYTINLCQTCYHLRQDERNRRPTTSNGRSLSATTVPEAHCRLAWVYADSKTRCGSAVRPKRCL